MKRAYISTIICITAAVSMWNICGIHAKAGEREDALESIYQQIAVKNKNEATANYSGDMIKIDEVQLYINSKDDPDNLFDGKVACERGHYHSAKVGNSYKLSIENGYEVDEADRLTDEMVDTISGKLDKTATDRKKMAAICDYIQETFDYDYELGERIEGRDKSAVHTNFVDAYYGDRKLLCGDYSQLAFILANKMGIDCEMIYGVDHAYNIVKFADSDHYIGYDLASDSRYAQITTIDYFTNDIYHLENASASTARNDPKVEIAMNNGATYECAGAKDLLSDFTYFAFEAHHLPELLILAVITIIILSTTIKAIKKEHKKILRKRRALLKRKARA